MFVRYVITLTFLIYSSANFAFDFSKLGFGDAPKKVATTPVEKLAEAMSEVEQQYFPETVSIRAEESIAFRGYTAVYIDGQYNYLINTNMDGDNHVVINVGLYADGTPRRMYLKQNGKWSFANEDVFIGYIKGQIIPTINPKFFIRSGGNAKPKAIVLLGDTCGHSQDAEEFLVNQKIPHLIMPVKFGKSSNTNSSLLCSNAATWADWSKGKPLVLQACNEAQEYDKFVEQIEPILATIQGVRERMSFPFFVYPNGDAESGFGTSKEDMKEFFNRLNASQTPLVN